MVLSAHAQGRMQSRCISVDVVQRVVQHGREVNIRGARLLVVGQREVRRARKWGLDLSECAGVHIVIPDGSNCVATVYRNQDFRGLRPRGNRRWRRRRGRGRRRRCRS